MAGKDVFFCVSFPLNLAVSAVDTGIRLEQNSYIFQTENCMWVYRHAFSDGVLSKALALLMVARGQYQGVCRGEMYVFMI